ncbi:MAG TPA: hypothetical protein VNT51_11860 [Miltoncostaeaceae bacterium]|nr:hypothetical protein [Miltoncostaeaceae bacterium]
MREELLAEPTLRTRLADRPAPPLLAPLVGPPLAPADADGLDLILEGFLAHHGRPRDLAPAGRDADVLAGDFCYAAGLVRVARSGDVFVVAALAELVALSAGLVADGRAELLPVLWRAVAAVVAHPDRAWAEDAWERALAAARAGGGAAELEALGAGVGDVPALAEALA